MGLLDNMPGMDTPEGQGLLSAAFSLMRAQKYPGQKGALAGALGDAGQTYLQSSNSSRDQMQRRRMLDAQMQAQQMQLEAQRRAQAERERVDGAIRNQFTPMDAQGALAGGGGPTIANAQKIGQMPSVDPLRALREGGPQALEQVMKINGALNPKPERGVLKPGDIVGTYGPDGTFNQTFAAPSAPKEKTLPAAIQEYEYAKGQGYKGTFDEWDKARKRAGATNVSMSNVTKQEGEESKVVGGFFGKSYADLQQSGLDAESKISRYGRLSQLLDGVSTGKFTATGLEVAKAASALGLNIDPNMANKEAAQALSSEIALQLRNPSGGAGMPGAMSDADRQFLANMVPGLATTPEGRKLMVETATKLAKRDKDVAAMARKYRQKHGNIDEGFYDELASYSADNPLFGGTTARPKTAMPALPPAQQHKGRVVRDTTTGKLLRSNGMTWVEEK